MRVHAAGVDRGVWHIVTGLPYPIRLAGYGFRRPKRPSPGMDLAGVVEAIGDGVVDVQIGDEVYGSTNGSFAEYAAVTATKLAPKPASLIVRAGRRGADLRLRRPAGGARPWRRAARRRRCWCSARPAASATSPRRSPSTHGADVTGVSRTDKVDAVRGFGVATVVDYTREDALDGSTTYDVIIDTGGHRRLRDLRRALTPRGRLVIVGSETGGRWLGGTDRQIRAVLWSLVSRRRMGSFISKEDPADLRVLTEMIEAGSVTPAVDQVRPLADAAIALDLLTSGQARGKLVLTARSSETLRPRTRRARRPAVREPRPARRSGSSR